MGVAAIVDEIRATWDGGGIKAVTKTADRLQKVFGSTKVAYAIELVELNIISDAYKQGRISKKQMVDIGVEVIKRHQVWWQEPAA